jgi:hypothetical protein
MEGSLLEEGRKRFVLDDYYRMTQLVEAHLWEAVIR